MTGPSGKGKKAEGYGGLEKGETYQRLKAIVG
jgi:hypothetical protein